MKHSFIIKSTHPSLKGHFPNNPIVPGVVILDEVINIIKKTKPNFIIDSMPIVKFLKPLLAEQNVIVEISQKSEQSIKFSCSHNNILISSGQFTNKNLS